MNALLRAAVLFALGLLIGMLLLERPRTGAAPGGAEQTRPAGTAPRPVGPDWGRVVVRASTGRPPLEAVGASDVGEAGPGGLEGPADPRDSGAPQLRGREGGAGGTADEPSGPARALPRPASPSDGAGATARPGPTGAPGSSEPPAGPAPEDRAAWVDSPAPLPDPVREVRPGETLSEIVYARYGTAPPRLVAALAAYNGLEDPDDLRVGALLRLPDRSLLDQ